MTLYLTREGWWIEMLRNTRRQPSMIEFGRSMFSNGLNSTNFQQLLKPPEFVSHGPTRRSHHSSMKCQEMYSRPRNDRASQGNHTSSHQNPVKFNLCQHTQKSCSQSRSFFPADSNHSSHLFKHSVMCSTRVVSTN